ncbi:hypothetical protein RBWH47_01410 [Rhodopirellula baltica WH47]|uniref:Uncharacterized protein n=1 Tax=Rhodopirellula baltica WH47 TaxID=991778 RepID=F2AZB7_RHOBT|nr:hypothetical protein RBWH47_01410 [Rhodopirellula baltica WH47]
MPLARLPATEQPDAITSEVGERDGLGLEIGLTEHLRQLFDSEVSFVTRRGEGIKKL